MKKRFLTLLICMLAPIALSGCIVSSYTESHWEPIGKPQIDSKTAQAQCDGEVQALCQATFIADCVPLVLARGAFRETCVKLKADGPAQPSPELETKVSQICRSYYVIHDHGFGPDWDEKARGKMAACMKEKGYKLDESQHLDVRKINVLKI